MVCAHGFETTIDSVFFGRTYWRVSFVQRNYSIVCGESNSFPPAYGWLLPAYHYSLGMFVTGHFRDRFGANRSKCTIIIKAALFCVCCALAPTDGLVILGRFMRIAARQRSYIQLVVGHVGRRNP